MNGDLVNQSSHDTLDSFLHTTRQPAPLSALRLFTHKFLSKRLLFISAGALAFTVPVVTNGLASDTLNTASSSSTTASSDANEGNLNVQLDQRASSSSSEGASSQTSLTINGETIPVSENSHVRKVITTDQQTTSVTIDTRSQQSESSLSSSSSMQIDTQSASQEGGSF